MTITQPLPRIRSDTRALPWPITTTVSFRPDPGRDSMSGVTYTCVISPGRRRAVAAEWTGRPGSNLARSGRDSRPRSVCGWPRIQAGRWMDARWTLPGLGCLARRCAPILSMVDTLLAAVLARYLATAGATALLPATSHVAQTDARRPAKSMSSHYRQQALLYSRWCS